MLPNLRHPQSPLLHIDDTFPEPCHISSIYNRGSLPVRHTPLPASQDQWLSTAGHHSSPPAKTSLHFHPQGSLLHIHPGKKIPSQVCYTKATSSPQILPS